MTFQTFFTGLEVEVEKMLETIKEQLEKQQQERKFSEKRIAEFIQTRVEELITDEA